MDLRKIIDQENIRAELVALQSEALIRQQAVRNEELAKIWAAFVQHFEPFPEFTLTTTEHEIRATYLQSNIIMVEDPSATVKEMPLSVGVKIIMPTAVEYKISTVYDTLQQEKTTVALTYRLSEGEKKILLLKRFISGEFVFTFQYRTKFRIKPYETMDEVLSIIN
ncbi:MAG: hypothetical protein WCL06_13050 [Bacteroidota bacterium]